MSRFRAYRMRYWELRIDANTSLFFRNKDKAFAYAITHTAGIGISGRVSTFNMPVRSFYNMLHSIFMGWTSDTRAAKDTVITYYNIIDRAYGMVHLNEILHDWGIKWQPYWIPKIVAREYTGDLTAWLGPQERNVICPYCETHHSGEPSGVSWNNTCTYFTCTKCGKEWMALTALYKQLPKP